MNAARAYSDHFAKWLTNIFQYHNPGTRMANSVTSCFSFRDALTNLQVSVIRDMIYYRRLYMSSNDNCGLNFCDFRRFLA